MDCQIASRDLEVLREALDVQPRRMAVVLRCCVVERIGEILRPVVAVEVLEESKASACIRWDIDDPYLLPRRCAAAVFGNLVGETDLAGGDEENAPFGTGPHVPERPARVP